MKKGDWDDWRDTTKKKLQEPNVPSNLFHLSKESWQECFHEDKQSSSSFSCEFSQPCVTFGILDGAPDLPMCSQRREYTSTLWVMWAYVQYLKRVHTTPDSVCLCRTLAQQLTYLPATARDSVGKMHHPDGGETFVGKALAKNYDKARYNEF